MPTAVTDRLIKKTIVSTAKALVSTAVFSPVDRMMAAVKAVTPMYPKIINMKKMLNVAKRSFGSVNVPKM